MIIIVDYGMGNIGSIRNMLRRVGVGASVSSDAAEIATAPKLILPGVGSFDAGMANIEARGIRAALTEAAQRGTPILGLCLGMQLLMEESEEGARPGLALVPGRVRRFRPTSRELKVPHMGWNTVNPRRWDVLFHALAPDHAFYFVHSYYVECANDAHVLATAHHGHDFVASLQRGQVFGTQFHPEKSHRHGLQLLKNFAELV